MSDIINNVVEELSVDYLSMADLTSKNGSLVGYKVEAVMLD